MIVGVRKNNVVCKVTKSREQYKIKLVYFLLPRRRSFLEQSEKLRAEGAKLRKNERKTKGKLVFLLLFRVPVTSAKPKLHKNLQSTACFNKKKNTKRGISAKTISAKTLRNLIVSKNFAENAIYKSHFPLLQVHP